MFPLEDLLETVVLEVDASDPAFVELSSTSSTTTTTTTTTSSTALNTAGAAASTSVDTLNDHTATSSSASLNDAAAAATAAAAVVAANSTRALRMAAIAAVAQQPQPDAACRLKLLRVEIIEEFLPKGAQLGDLSCAVNVKEKVEINGRRKSNGLFFEKMRNTFVLQKYCNFFLDLGENRLIQKRKTMAIDWEKCFDVGILPGRVIQILVMFEKVLCADATMRLEVHFLVIFISVSSSLV